MSGDEAAASAVHGVHRHVWGATVEEEQAKYRCDDILPEAPGRWLRAVTSTATPESVFRRVCHLRAAPYSYDLLDNRGRRSPTALLPWCDSIEPGQTVMTIFTAESVVPGREVTIRMNAGTPVAIFGDLALTYRIIPAEPGTGCRLVATMRVCDGPGPASRLRRRALAWGDLIMMRKQLRTLVALAESDEDGGDTPAL